MAGAKTSAHSFNNEHGRTSSGDLLDGIAADSVRISSVNMDSSGVRPGGEETVRRLRNSRCDVVTDASDVINKELTELVDKVGRLRHCRQSSVDCVTVPVLFSMFCGCRLLQPRL